MNIFSSVKSLLLKHIQSMEENRKEFVKDPLRDFTRTRKLSFADTILLLISMECGSIRSELLKFFDYNPETASTSAFIQQRDKLKPNALCHLFHSFSLMWNHAKVTTNELLFMRCLRPGISQKNHSLYLTVVMKAIL